MKKDKFVAVFVPVFNEEETLSAILSNVPDKIFNYKTVMIVADDGSVDRSVAIASEFTRHIVKLQENSGVGVTTKKGLEYIINLGIDFSFLIKFDADGQHDLNFLPQIVAKLHEGSDVVVCSRFHPLSNHTHTPIDRILLNCIFSDMVRRITGWNLTDVRSGYMGFHFELIKQIASSLSVKRYGIPMDILLRIWGMKKDARISEIPHPALYDTRISAKLGQKYRSEDTGQKATRLQDAFCALLQIIEEMNIPREHILQMSGYENY